ncbi:MAG: hypothetical protein WBV46_18280 [Terriglobales bacterium]
MAAFISVSSFISLLLTISVNAQAPIDFSGHWGAQTSSGARRELDIEQNGQSLVVKTIVTNSQEANSVGTNSQGKNSQGSRQMEVKYVIGGAETSYTGLDGDEFRTSVRWDGSTLVFDTVEHEDGRDIPERAVWALVENRNALQVARQSGKTTKTSQTLIRYVRQPN